MDSIRAVKTALNIQRWTPIIEECQRSGMNVYDWCQQHNVSRDQYYYWLRRCREATLKEIASCTQSSIVPCNTELSTTCDTDNQKITFKKLEVTPPAPNLGAAVIIHLPNATLEVTNDASQRTVEAVLMALKSVC